MRADNTYGELVESILAAKKCEFPVILISEEEIGDGMTRVGVHYTSCPPSDVRGAAFLVASLIVSLAAREGTTPKDIICDLDEFIETLSHSQEEVQRGDKPDGASTWWSQN